MQNQENLEREDLTNPMYHAIKDLQNRLNECIEHDLADLKDRLYLRLQHLNEKQVEFLLLLELSSNTYIEQKLAQLRKYEAIRCLFPYVDNPDYVDEPNFIWNSSFLECLSTDERRKYRNFDFSNFDKRKYVIQNNFYDDCLPYFSQIVQFIAFSRYINKIQDLLKYYKKESLMEEKKMAPSNEKPVTKEKKTFESNFNDQQIEILTDCINEIRIFTSIITKETTAKIFSCQLETPLRAANNRWLAAFFKALGDACFTTSNWQSVCESNQLFLSSRKGKILQQTDLSSATNGYQDSHTKQWEIIGKYIKKLQKP